MIKREFIAFYKKHNNMKRTEEARKEVERFIETFCEALKQDPELLIRGVGSFRVKKTKSITVVDPRDISQKIQTVPRKYLKFKASPELEKELCDID